VPSLADWTLITVSYNSRTQLEKFWRHLPTDQLTWIVVDNASLDGSAATATHLGARVVARDSNTGFAAANNCGLRLCDTEYVAFVNPDVLVDTGSLSQLGRTIDATDGIVAPQLMNTNGSLQSNSRGLPFLIDKFAHRGLRLPGSRLAMYAPRETSPGPYYVAWLMGAAVCAHTATFRALGAWDTDFFVYYEDHELGLRAWRQGIPIVIEPRARWMHAWARGTVRLNGSAWRHEARSAITFYRRFPELVLPRRRLARRRHPLLSERFLTSPTVTS
jgi:N-acetylglucosaminyl-diphospho-decaprenol L-rhamnosyltransferase